jgi:alkyl sulfatase BDS1-like metallo-beta-lactamase superfamily hydrolase
MEFRLTPKAGAAALLAAGVLAGCAAPSAVPQNAGSLQAGQVSSATREVLATFAQSLPPDDAQDREDAQRGLIARPTGQVRDAGGRVLKDFASFDFVQGTAPDSVNPSLWRHARLNAQAGLFKVSDGIYQLRGFDIGNITLVEGKTGWIVVDTLTSREIAAAAMAFARQHLGNKPVTALIFTHSHADHFGGALGVISPRKWRGAKCPWWRLRAS